MKNKTNILTTLFLLYLICFQNALNANNHSKKILSNARKLRNTKSETYSESKSDISNSSAEKKKKTPSLESSNLMQSMIQTNSNSNLNLNTNLSELTKNKIQISNLLKKTMFSSTSNSKQIPTGTSAEVSQSEQTLRDKMKSASYKYKAAGACVKGVISAFPSSFCVKSDGDAGILPTECVDGWVRSGALCYKQCKSDMKLVAGVCWRNCKDGYKDIGWACFKKPFKFYFKSSYITKSATNFDTQSKCKKGYYKFGALCYRDCNNINMANCGIGYCALDKKQCELGITSMTIDVAYGIMKIVLFIMTFGTSTAGAVQVNAAKTSIQSLQTSFVKSLVTSIKATVKKLVDKVNGKLTKSYIKSKIQEKTSKEYFQHKVSTMGRNILIPTAVNTICNKAAANLFVNQDESTQSSASEFDFMVLDIFGFANAAISCDSVQSENDKAKCAVALIDLLDKFDPTGVFTLASAFMSPLCNVPGSIVSYEPDDGCVRFYEKPDYEGDYIDVCSETSAFFNTFGKKASSMKLSETIEIWIWSGENFTGVDYYFDPFTYIHDLSLVDLNDTIGSFKIRHVGARENCIVIFDQCDYKGNSYQYCESQTDVLKNLNNFNIKSAIAGIGKGAYFYTETSYKSTNYYKLMDNTSVSCFTSTNIGSSQIKSFNIIPMANPGCVKFFKGTNFTGDSAEVCSNNSDSKYSSYLSLVIGSNTLLTVHPLTSYKGIFYNLIYSMNISVLKENLNTNSLGMLNQVSFQSFLISKTTPSSGCIVVFEEPEFKGRAREICQGETSFEFNDSYKAEGKYESISSIIIGENVQVLQLFTEEYFKGTSVDLLSEIDLETSSSATQFENLALFNIDQLVKSIKLIPKITQNCALVFSMTYFRGVKAELCSESATYTSTVPLKMSSFVVKDLVQLALYTTSDFKTMFNYYNGYIENTGENNDLTVKSFLAYELTTISPKSGCINFFPQKDFQGKIVRICTSVTDFSTSASKYLSLKVGQGFREILFFSEINYYGNRYSIDDSVEIIDLTLWNYSNIELSSTNNVAFTSMKSLFFVPLPPDNGCVKFFQKTLFQGTSVVICESDNIDIFTTDLQRKFTGNTRSILVGDDTQFVLSISNSSKYIPEKNLHYLTSVQAKDISNLNSVSTINYENSIDVFYILDLSNIPERSGLFFSSQYYQGYAIRLVQPSINLSIAIKSFRVGNMVRQVKINKNSNSEVSWESGIHSKDVYDIKEVVGTYDGINMVKIVPFADADCIYIYSELENHSVCKSYSTLDTTFYQGKDFNMLFYEIATAIVTSENTAAFIFSGENYTGSVKKIDPLGSNIGGFASATNILNNYLFRSIVLTKIETGCVRIFTVKNVNGISSSQQFCSSTATLNGNFDKAASIIVGKSMNRVVLYSGEKYTGTAKELSPNGYVLDLSVDKFTVIKSILFVPNVSDDCVLVNDQCGFLGKSIEICGSIDKISTARDELKSFTFKSIMIGKNFQARFYEKENYEGNYISFSYESSKLYSSCITDSDKENFAYSVNSILLTSKTPKFNCIMVFQDCNYLGERLEVCYDVASGLAAKIPKISSIKTGSSTEVKIWDKDNFAKLKYSSVTIAKNDLTNQTCLSTNNTVLNAKSLQLFVSADEIKLSSENCLRVFSECNYNGNVLEICSDIASKSANSLLANFNISSFKLGQNNQVTLWQQDYYTGSNVVYSKELSKTTSTCVQKDITTFVINSMKFLSSTPANDAIMIYTEPSYLGVRYELTENSADLSKTTFKSYKIGAKVWGYLYREKNYGTTNPRISFEREDVKQLTPYNYLSVEIKKDWSAPRTNSGDSVTQITESVTPVETVQAKIPVANSECYILYSECDYKGTYVEFCNANGNVKENIEKVSSVVVGKNLNVNLYDQSNYEGNTVKLEESKSYSCLDSYNFLDKTNSVSIQIVDPNKFY